MAYSYSTLLTIDHTKVSGGSDLSDFPLLVSLVDPHFRSVGNGGSVTSSSGYDLIFMDSTGSVQLDHEIETYSPTTGALVAWVRVPTLSASVDTVLRVYAGDAAVTTSQEHVAGVWNPGASTLYRGVWHLGESAGVVRDSSAYGTNGTIAGSVTQGAGGKIGNALAFSGVSAANFVTMGEPVDGHLDAGVGSWTVSGWMFITAATGTWQIPLWKGGSSAAAAGYDWEVGPTLRTYADVSDGVATMASTSPFATAATWVHVVLVVDRTAAVLRISLNGVEYGPNKTIASIGSLSGTSPLQLGSTGASFPFNGLLDEIRVQARAVTTGWIATEYVNQNSPATFATLGSPNARAGRGRVRVSIRSVRTAAGRMRGAVRSARTPRGRANLWGQALRLGFGRVRMAVVRARTGLGRVRSARRGALVASGRVPLARSQSAAAIARTRLAAPRTGAAHGRLKLETAREMSTITVTSSRGTITMEGT